MEDLTPLLSCIVFIGALILLLRNTNPVDEKKLHDLILDVNKKEASLKRISELNKEWDDLIKKRSLALKESTLDNYKKIDAEIDLVRFKIELLVNN